MSHKTRTTRTLLGLLAALGLVGALTMPALASHETDLELVDPGANSDECEGYDFGFKLDNMDQLKAGVYTASDENHTVWIEIELFENEEGEVNAYDILDSDPEISDIFVKQPNEGGGISHLTFCYDEGATPTPTPSESEGEATPTPTPSESEGEATPTPTPSESEGEATPTPSGSTGGEASPSGTPRESVAGGNPTPAPSGGDLPDTAMGSFGQVPATVLSLVLLGALAAMVYARLARQR